MVTSATQKVTSQPTMKKGSLWYPQNIAYTITNSKNQTIHDFSFFHFLSCHNLRITLGPLLFSQPISLQMFLISISAICTLDLINSKPKLKGVPVGSMEPSRALNKVSLLGRMITIGAI